MDKRCIDAPNAPPAAGPYSHAVAAGNLLFVSGQVALEPDGSGPRRGSFEQEARLALSNLQTVLKEAGSGLDQVVKTTIYLADMDHFAAFNAVYQEFFTAVHPARTCIEAGRLPLDLQIEIDAIALLSH